MINENQIESLSNFYKAIGDVTRMKILLKLVDGEKTVSELVELLCMSQSAISHQLQVLRSHRIVKNVRSGKCVIYSIDDTHVLNTLLQGIEHMKHGGSYENC